MKNLIIILSLAAMVYSCKKDDNTTEFKATDVTGKTIVKEIDISTLFNASRELYASSESLIDSLKVYLLDAEHLLKLEEVHNIPEIK